MMYTIPTSKIQKLSKIIKKYQKKGALISFKLGDKVTEKGNLHVIDHVHHCQYEESINVDCVEVFVEGTYRINGWSFVGTVEFTDNGNIIRLADSSFEGKVPAKYLHTPKICEHCGTIRNRKDTYLICSDEGEWKQVGSSCLLEYTQGLDADECASIMSCLDKMIELSNHDCDETSFLGNGFDATGYGMNRNSVLPIAYAYVKQYGYQRMLEGNGTAHDVLIMLWKGMHDEEMTRRYESLVMPTDEELAKVDAFAQEHINDEFDYMRNASLAWLNNSIEYRDFGLISSFVNTYFKEVARLEKQRLDAESKNNTWVGEINERITLKVKYAKVLYYKDNSYKSYYAEATMVYEIIDTEGHTFKWSTTNVIYPDDVITATVKAHEIYGKFNTKQTVITRGKVIK